jgi:hypothetical protein
MNSQPHSAGTTIWPLLLPPTSNAIGMSNGTRNRGAEEGRRHVSGRTRSERDGAGLLLLTVSGRARPTVLTAATANPHRPRFNACL